MTQTWKDYKLVIELKEGDIMKKKKLWERICEHWQLFIFIMPAFAYTLLFDYKPMYGIIIAFQDYKLMQGVSGSVFVGLSNFVRLFSSYWLPIIIKNTLTISLLSIVLSFPMPIMLALMINEVRTKVLKKVFQTVSYAPHFISIVVVCGMISLFLSRDGVITKALVVFGVKDLRLLQSPAAFKWIYVLSGIWQNVGWNAIIYFAALSGVDPQLLEAAEIDGANRVQKNLHVNLPVLVPTITVLLILQCGTILGIGYEKVYLLQNPMNIAGSEVISTYVYKMGLEQEDFAFSTAAGLFNSVVNGVVLITVNEISKRVSENSLW